MNETNITKVDFNLLKALNALLIEQHVGRAAKKMHVSQSAMSHTLSRLRMTFDDQLFIRTSKGLEPTAKALSLASRVVGVLNDIDYIFAPETFAPETVSLVFRIQTHDFIVVSYLAKILSEIRTIAPGIIFDIQNVNSECYIQLEKGECDLIIGAGLSAKNNLRQKSFVTEKLVCLIDQKHPARESWQTNVLFEYPHISLSLLESKADPILQHALKNNLPAPTIGLYTDSLQSQPAFIRNSLLIGVLPESMANWSANAFDLLVKPCPIILPQLTIKGIWHERNQKHQVHQWLRNKISEYI